VVVVVTVSLLEPSGDVVVCESLLDEDDRSEALGERDGGAVAGDGWDACATAVGIAIDLPICTTGSGAAVGRAAVGRAVADRLEPGEERRRCRRAAEGFVEVGLGVRGCRSTTAGGMRVGDCRTSPDRAAIHSITPAAITVAATASADEFIGPRRIRLSIMTPVRWTCAKSASQPASAVAISTSRPGGSPGEDSAYIVNRPTVRWS